MDPFPLAGLLRRIRRTADCSQRELAERTGISKTAVAAAERSARDLPVSVLATAAALVGARLALLDASGRELTPMDAGAVRDRAGRRFPAHLDTRHGDIDWWHGDERYSRERPRYTFDRSRYTRDHWRDRSGTPEDHQQPQAGDSLAERRRRREEEAEQRRLADLRRRRAAGELPEPVEWTCECPPGCDYDEVLNEDMTHVPGCVCQCDLD